MCLDNTRSPRKPHPACGFGAVYRGVYRVNARAVVPAPCRNVCVRLVRLGGATRTPEGTITQAGGFSPPVASSIAENSSRRCRDAAQSTADARPPRRAEAGAVAPGQPPRSCQHATEAPRIRAHQNESARHLNRTLRAYVQTTASLSLGTGARGPAESDHLGPASHATLLAAGRDAPRTASLNLWHAGGLAIRVRFRGRQRCDGDRRRGGSGGGRRRRRRRDDPERR